MSNVDLADFAVKDGAVIKNKGRSGLIVDAIAWSLALAILALIVPKFETIFRDFGIDLSWLMLGVVRASHYWLAFVGLAVVVLVVDSIGRDLLARRKDGLGLARSWAVLMFALPLSTIAIMLVQLAITLAGLGSKLSG